MNQSGGGMATGKIQGVPGAVGGVKSKRSKSMPGLAKTDAGHSSRKPTLQEMLESPKEIKMPLVANGGGVQGLQGAAQVVAKRGGVQGDHDAAQVVANGGRQRRAGRRVPVVAHAGEGVLEASDDGDAHEIKPAAARSVSSIWTWCTIL